MIKTLINFIFCMLLCIIFRATFPDATPGLASVAGLLYFIGVEIADRLNLIISYLEKDKKDETKES